MHKSKTCIYAFDDTASGLMLAIGNLVSKQYYIFVVATYDKYISVHAINWCKTHLSCSETTLTFVAGHAGQTMPSSRLPRRVFNVLMLCLKNLQKVREQWTLINKNCMFSI